MFPSQPKRLLFKPVPLYRMRSDRIECLVIASGFPSTNRQTKCFGPALAQGQKTVLPFCSIVDTGCFSGLKHTQIRKGMKGRPFDGLAGNSCEKAGCNNGGANGRPFRPPYCFKTVITTGCTRGYNTAGPSGLEAK